MHQHIDSAKKLVDSFWNEPDENERIFVNIVRYTVEACERKNFDIMKAVKDNYARVLARDPSLNDYLH